METANSEQRTPDTGHRTGSASKIGPIRQECGSLFGRWTSLLTLCINPMMDDLSQLLQLMQDDPAKFQGLSIEKISRFIDYATLLKRDILLTESALHPASEPPPCLPDLIKTFLEQARQLPSGYAASCWDIFKQTVWDANQSNVEKREKDFREHGHVFGLSVYT
jgi:hypothetical protein